MKVDLADNEDSSLPAKFSLLQCDTWLFLVVWRAARLPRCSPNSDNVWVDWWTFIL